MQERRLYPSDLADQQWESIKDLIPLPRPGGRKRSTDVRRVVDAILYLNRSGCAWRYLPSEYPNWKTVYDYFQKWSRTGVWYKINFILNAELRRRLGRNDFPSLGIVDAQSIRCHYGGSRGYDPIKKVRGRKRNIIVDTLGLLWACEVHSAKEIDAVGGLAALEKMHELARNNIKCIIGDSVYKWPFDYFAETQFGIKSQLIETRILGSNMKPKRWIVERTFAWFNHFRRLARDYERSSRHSEAMLHLAMIALLLNRVST